MEAATPVIEAQGVKRSRSRSPSPSERPAKEPRCGDDPAPARTYRRMYVALMGGEEPSVVVHATKDAERSRLVYDAMVHTSAVDPFDAAQLLDWLQDDPTQHDAPLPTTFDTGSQQALLEPWIEKLGGAFSQPGDKWSGSTDLDDCHPDGLLSVFTYMKTQ